MMQCCSCGFTCDDGEGERFGKHVCEPLLVASKYCVHCFQEGKYVYATFIFNGRSVCKECLVTKEKIVFKQKKGGNGGMEEIELIAKGKSSVGKTTLLQKLVAFLKKEGYEVGKIIDYPKKAMLKVRWEQ